MTRLGDWWRGNSREEQNRVMLGVLGFLGIVIAALIAGYFSQYRGGAESSPKSPGSRASSEATASSQPSPSQSVSEPAVIPTTATPSAPAIANPAPTPASSPSDGGLGGITSIQILDDTSVYRNHLWSYSPIDNGSTAVVKFQFVVLGKDGAELDDHSCHTLATITQGGHSVQESQKLGCTTASGNDGWKLGVGSYRLIVKVTTDWGATDTKYQDFAVTP